jgi:3-deoxy-7-phosphoheptulonate synthase
VIIIMKPNATKDEVDGIVARVHSEGYGTHLSAGEERTIIGVIGNDRRLPPQAFELLAGVERVVPVLKPFKLASRDFQPSDTVVPINGVSIGSTNVVVIAGPCSVESREQLMETAWAVKEAGVHILRGGAFKPRSSPYSFQGLGREGLELLAEARQATGLAVVTEVMAPEDVPVVAQYSDILQIGARNMQNFALLHAAGASGKPILLKRSMMATLEEMLLSAEYILTHDNYRVILCERGIRTFETYTRNTLDINGAVALKQLSHLPVIVDPSHGTGRWEMVGPVARAAIAAGVDGLIIEVHPHPELALSDGAQSLKPERFSALMKELSAVAQAVGRQL